MVLCLTRTAFGSVWAHKALTSLCDMFCRLLSTRRELWRASCLSSRLAGVNSGILGSDCIHGRDNVGLANMWRALLLGERAGQRPRPIVWLGDWCVQSAAFSTADL